MIKGIEIIINNGMYEDKYLISCKNKLFFKNNKEYELNDEFFSKLKNTILYWENEYGTSSMLDVEEFTVKVYTNTNVDIYHGKGIYPSNYKYFKELLGDENG